MASYTEQEIARQAFEEMDGMDENAAKILFMRMIRKHIKEEGKPRLAAESISEMLDRVANHVGRSEEPRIRKRFRDLLATRVFFPNSPTFTGAGTPLNQLAACFVLPISDDMGRASDGIFSTLRVAALIQQSGGGNGFNFGDLRERGAPVNSSNGISTGPVGFLKMYTGCFATVSQGGSRRGANMGVMPVDHPDIEEFITCKSESEDDMTNFNISVAITDAFMKAVVEGSSWDLISPANKRVTKTIDARQLFEKIATHACSNGEPGVLFIDEANRWNPVPKLYRLKATNPCGEQWLGPYENCCLGSIKLPSVFCRDTGRISAYQLERVTRDATHFLDCVVEENGYVPAVPELREAAMRCRRIGLGIMGLGDLLYLLNVRYGSEEAQWVAHLIMRFIRYHALRKSCELAESKGPALAIEDSIYAKKTCAETIRKAFAWRPDFTITKDFGDIEVTDQMIEDLAAYATEHGVRNLAQLTIAPTGSISQVTGCETGGCEPMFMLAYTRNVVRNDRINPDEEEHVQVLYRSKLLEERLREHGMSEEEIALAFEEIRDHNGSCANVLRIPEEIRRVFVVSGDIPWREHVKMQATLQRSGVDNSISKTINLPEGSTVEDVGSAYQMAYELGCKGITVYVDKSRKKVVLEATKKQDTSSEGKKKSNRPSPVSIEPAACVGMVSPYGHLWTNVVLCPQDLSKPKRVFFTVGKAGSDVQALAEGFGRLISFALSEEIAEMDRMDRLVEAAAQLCGIGGTSKTGLGEDKVLSLPDTMGVALSKFCEQHGFTVKRSPSYDMCTECSSRLVREEGCLRCVSCGWSRC